MPQPMRHPDRDHSLRLGVSVLSELGRRVTVATDATTPNDNAEENSALVPSSSISTNQLREIHSFDDALRVMEETYGADALALASDALGDGFALAKSKDQLIGVPCAFISWNDSLGDHGPFVAARLVTQDGRKLVITDGSEGIFRQLMDFQESKGRSGGLVAKNGLRRSDYSYVDSNGEEKPATTYYIDTSA